MCWRFSHVDHEGPWSFRDVDTDTFCWILERLANFETMTVNEVFRNGEEPGKSYDVEALPTAEARERLEAMRLSDQTKIHRLRFQGKQRLYGFLHENVFHVIWWDPEHKVWPSKLRNT